MKLGYQRVALRSFVMAFPREETAIRVSGALIALLIAAYLILVGLTTFNVIARKEALDAMTSVRTNVGGLERDYFALSQQVTPDQGAQLGLGPVSHTSYVRRPGAVGVVSVRNEI